MSELLVRLGRGPYPGWQRAALPAEAGKSEIDPLLRSAEGRVVVRGTDAELAAVVLRLLRTELLERTVVGFEPLGASAVARLYRIRGVDARTGDARGVPLLRDDSGGVLIGAGEFAPFDGTAYVDEHLLLRGRCERIRVRPDPTGRDGLVATASGRGGFRRPRRLAGRAVQFGAEPITVVRDGARQPMRAPRWTWYRHTSPLMLVTGRARA